MTFQSFVAEAERKLANHNASLPEEFRRALDGLRPSLSEADLRSSSSGPSARRARDDSGN